MEKILYIIKKIIPALLLQKLRPIYHFGLNWLAAAWHRNPSNKLIVIGVTGTTGKTTTVYLIAKMLESAGLKAGYTSTAMFCDGKKEWLNAQKMTMLGRFFTQKMLAKMVKNNCQIAIVETTSEGIVQFRHRFINYDILVFTGLYPEHLEAHGGFQNYKKAKTELFAHLKKCKKKKLSQKIEKTAIINVDDEHAEDFLRFWAEKKYGFGVKSQKSEQAKSRNESKVESLDFENLNLIKAENIEIKNARASFSVKNMRVNLNILGDFSAINALAAMTAGLALGIDLEKLKKGIESVRGIPGRLERIEEGQAFSVIVDYAFEPQALAKLYETVSSIPHAKIIHVLGSAGGGRDKSRRGPLGKIAGEKADIVIVTNEDPYDEDPSAIIGQVAKGALAAGKKMGENLFQIEDRKQAIQTALKLAKKNDMVLITGKGCEQAICASNGKKIKWDDREAVREILLYQNLNKLSVA